MFNGAPAIGNCVFRAKVCWRRYGLATLRGRAPPRAFTAFRAVARKDRLALLNVYFW
jgi:hypothetical protein